MSSHTHFTVHIDDQLIAHVGMDIQDSSVNLMRRDVMQELGGLMRDLADRPDLTGLIFSSTKQMGFVFGADINEFES